MEKGKIYLSILIILSFLLLAALIGNSKKYTKDNIQLDSEESYYFNWMNNL